MNWTDSQECAMQLQGRDILVSAAAGSGKTATLTQRIIRSLTAEGQEDSCGDISRMLIVTFTRAAAAELRSRISDALSQKIASCEDDRLRARLNDQLLKVGSAHISTIDSFYQDIVRANFERLGLPAGFRLAEETELFPLKEQLLSRLIDSAYRASADAEPTPDAPLDAISGNAFALAMDDLLANRDHGDLAQILLKLYQDLLCFPEELGLLRTHADRLVEQASLDITQTSEGRILLNYYLPLLEELRSQLIRSLEILPLASASAKKIPMFQNDLETVEILIDALSHDDWDQAHKTITAYRPQGDMRGVTYKNAPPHYELVLRARELAADLLLKQLPTYFECNAAECADRMRRTARTERAVYELLTAFDESLLQEKKRRGTFDFADIRRFMLRLLEDKDGTPTDITLALRDRFDAVYIDEYQDVDTVQDRIFALIGAGGKRFMVGDIKQSIYGFRGAEPSLFAGYKASFPAVRTPSDPALSPSGNRIYMSENFRCDHSVIHFTNDVCSYLFEVCPHSLGYSPEEDDLVAGKPQETRPTPVQVVLIPNPPRGGSPIPGGYDGEGLYVASEIARLIRTEHLDNGSPIRPRDIAILVHSDKHIESLTDALRLYGIPTGRSSRVDLAAHPDMTMMVNLLSVIDNPHDDVPLMGLLSTPNSPISLADILTVRDGHRAASSLYDDLAAALQDGDAWSADTRRAMSAFLRQLDEWRALAATLPADKLLRRIYAHPSLAPLATSPALLSIYDHARRYQNASFCGLYQFLQHFKSILEVPDALSAAGLKEPEDAVQIMTIHKSKGLEFPVVFLYDCSHAFNRADERGTVVFDVSLGMATKLYDAATSSMTSSLTRAVIAHRIREDSAEEEMRVLYVALTRARERLYLTGSVSSKAEENANKPTRGNRHAILHASNNLAWVLSALSEANRRREMDDSIVRIERQELDALALLAEPPALVLPTSEPMPEQQTHPDAAFYQSILEAHRDFVDPRAYVRRLPTKAAASKLRVAMLDGVWLAEEFGGESNGEKSRDGMSNETEAYVRSRIELMQSAQRPFDELVRAGRTASPAERGTATHLFLQHCDFSRLAACGVDDELARLVEQGFLPRRAASVVRREQLQAFVASELFSLVSDGRCKLYRELHFDRFIPYATLTRSDELAAALGDYTLYVQGSLDLLVEDAEGTLWLCDYKTDRILAEDEVGIRDQLVAAHADQLRIYAEAVHGLFGRRPDHILIYSLPLGKSVELTQYL